MICPMYIVVTQVFGYGHPLWMNIPGHLHEAWVIAHAAVHGDQGIDAGVSCCRKQARSSAPTPAHYGDLG